MTYEEKQVELEQIFKDAWKAYSDTIKEGFAKLNLLLDEIIDNTPKSNTQSL